MNVFELMAKIGLDDSEYVKGLKSAGDKIASFGSSMAKIGTTTAKITGAAITAASGAMTALAKMATDSYAEYEQLVGGVDTLFKESSDRVQQYAKEAYKTAGISANEYMETVTSFSASLLQSLGGDTKKAADTADMAIRDMSDNANKMGTAMEAIQNAYQGFAKQNYTMLDNLKLGYGGTKEEMQRLLDDASAISGIKYDLSNLSDVYEAIHVIQTELGITGTTAKEAADTIAGSAGSLKAAFDNLIAGLANPDADLGELIDEVVSSAEVAFSNILPTFEKALLGIGDLISRIAPVIVERLSELVEQLLPELLNTAVSLVETLANALPEIVGTLITQLGMVIIEQAPQLIDTAIEVVNMLVDAFTDPTTLEMLTQAAITLIAKYYSAITDPKLLKKLGQAAIQIVKQLGEGLISNADAIIQRAVELINMLVEGVTENLPMILDLAVRVVLAFAEALTQALPTLIPAIVQAVITIVQTLLDPANISMLVNAAIQLVKGLASGLIAAVPLLIDALPEIIQALLTAILEALPQLFNMGIELMVQLSMGLIAAIPNLIKMIPQLIAAIVLALKDGAVAMVESGQELIDNLLSAFTDNPILNSFEEWWEELSEWWDETLAKVFDWGVDLLETFENGVRSVMGSDWVDFWEEVGGDIYDYLHFSQPDKGPLSGPNGFKSFGPDLVKTFVEGVKSNEHLLEDEMSNLMGTVDTAMGEPIGMTGINGVPIGTGSLNQNAQSGQTIVIQIDGETFGKFVYKYGQQEVQRVGAKLTEG